MRLTVLGTSTAQAEPTSPTSGLLVQSDDTSLLLDCGLGVVRALQAHCDPRTLAGVVIGHLHADHFLDLVLLRYLFPWPGCAVRLPVLVPPGGRARFASLAHAISERPTFFDDAFELREYTEEAPIELGDLQLRFQHARHYVPAWSCQVVGPDGERLAYLGDTGPGDRLVEFATGADCLVLEATLASARDDDDERGHLTAEEAVSIAVRSGARQALLVHYPSRRRTEIADACAASGGLVAPAIAGMRVEISSWASRGATPVSGPMTAEQSRPPGPDRVAMPMLRPASHRPAP